MGNSIKLYGRIFIESNIQLVTGLHIGGSGGVFSIGSTDKTVITDPISGQPYIPGSSLRGKMRSLTEKYEGVSLRSEGRKTRIHEPRTEQDYLNSSIAQIYGIAAENFSLPTRLIVRDVRLTEESAKELRRARTDLPYTDIKTEVSIDRITSQANPRQIERVPAGAVFGPSEMVYSIYRESDVDRFRTLLDGMQFLEDDYLGGHGSRGYGKIVFVDLKVHLKPSASPSHERLTETYLTLAALLDDREGLIQRIKLQLAPLFSGG